MQLKFRIWDSENPDGPTMHYANGLQTLGNVLIADIEFKEPHFRNYTENAPIMMSSGRKDKSGTEIYAGDCLGHMSNVVEFDNDGFNTNGDRPLWMMCDKMEVVGNIYEGLFKK